MKRRYLYTFFLCFFIIECVLIFQMVKQSDVPEMDVVEIHDLSQLLDIENPSYEAIDAKSIYDFSILNTQGTLQYQGNESCATSLYEAWQNHNVVIPLSNGSQALIQDPRIAFITQQQNQQLLFFLCLFILQIIGAISYVEWLRYRVFSPFQKLRMFAQSITSGNLDVPLFMDKHQVFGAFSESFDMMRVELKKAKEQEVAANQSKKELIAKLSHDIKTPVASIKAVSELMQVQTKNPKEQEQISNILAKADQIDGLISNMFHATLEELQQLDVHPEIASTQVLFTLLKQADYQARVHVHTWEDALLYYDSLRVSQVFDNLLANAYKYAEGSIDVYGTCKDDFYELILQDHGGGVCEEECVHILEKYYRGANAKGKSGSGLGLYISSYFLQAMQASITISNYQDGLRITICLPYAK